MWRRLAPSAARTASSRVRPEARARIRLATLAQAISSTSATAPMMRKSVARTRLTRLSRSGSATNVFLPLLSGKAKASWRPRADEARVRGRHGDTRREPGHGPVVVAGAIAILRIERGRRPHLGIGGKPHGRGHHAHDLVGLVLDEDGLAQGGGGAAEVALGEGAAHDRRPLGVVAIQEPPRLGRNPEHAEEVRVDELGPGELGVILELDAHRTAVVVREGLELREGADVHLVPARQVGHGPPRVRPATQHHDQAVRIGIPERPQHDPADHAEDRGVRPHPHGQRQDDRRGEPGRAPQHPHRVLQVPPRVVQPHERPRVPLQLLRLLDSSERPPSREPGFLRGHAPVERSRLPGGRGEPSPRA